MVFLVPVAQERFTRLSATHLPVIIEHYNQVNPQQYLGITDFGHTLVQVVLFRPRD